MTSHSEPHFVINHVLSIEETRHYEFKSVMSKRPVDAIKNLADEYVVAFLNSEGGRIYFGVRDDRSVEGVRLTTAERDQLRKDVASKLFGIRPSLAPTSFRIECHQVYSEGSPDQLVPDLFVVEVVAPRPPVGPTLYSTASGDVFVRLDGGKKKLTTEELQAETVKRIESKGVLTGATTTVPAEQLQVAFCFDCSDDGDVIDAGGDFAASAAEVALSAATHRVVAKPHWNYLDGLDSAIARVTRSDASPADRMMRVQWIQQKMRLQTRVEFLGAVVTLAFTKRVTDQLLSLNQVSDVIRGAAKRILRLQHDAQSRTGFDVWRVAQPSLKTSVDLDRSEVEEMVRSGGWDSVQAFAGPGWDLFDFPESVRVGKAIPAILSSVVEYSARRGAGADSLIVADVLLGFDSWSVGLK